MWAENRCVLCIGFCHPKHDRNFSHLPSQLVMTLRNIMYSSGSESTLTPLCQQMRFIFLSQFYFPLDKLNILCHLGFVMEKLGSVLRSRDNLTVVERTNVGVESYKENWDYFSILHQLHIFISLESSILLWYLWELHRSLPPEARKMASFTVMGMTVLCR